MFELQIPIDYKAPYHLYGMSQESFSQEFSYVSMMNWGQGIDDEFSCANMRAAVLTAVRSEKLIAVFKHFERY